MLINKKKKKKRKEKGNTIKRKEKKKPKLVDYKEESGIRNNNAERRIEEHQGMYVEILLEVK